MAEIPSGLDRCDGLSGRPGTPTPASAIITHSSQPDNSQPIEEAPESPTIERAEQCTVRHDYTLSWNEALTRLAGLGRGVVRTDSLGNQSFLLSASITHQAPNSAKLTTVEEMVSFDPPPDEFSLEMVNLGLHIMKHPRYFYALQGATDADAQVNTFVIRAVQDYMDNPSYPYRNALPKLISDGIGHYHDTGYLPGTDLAKRAALEIIQKFWRNEETPYVVGLVITWAQYYFRPPHLNPGSYVEDPVSQANPQLPDYFWYTADADSIVSKFSEFNPQCYSTDGTSTGPLVISWLRQADKVQFQRTWFRLERSWMGSPVGYWDPQLYSRSARPAAPDDYLAMDASSMPDYLNTTA